MRVLLLLIVWSLTEIALFVTLGGALGLGLTLAWVLATGVLGVALIRRQGVQVGLALRREMAAARDPGFVVADSALVLLAAVLLILPGFLSDAVGLVLLVPAVRRLVVSRIGARAARVRPVSQPWADVIDAEVVEEVPGPALPHQPSGWTKL